MKTQKRRTTTKKKAAAAPLTPEQARLRIRELAAMACTRRVEQAAARPRSICLGGLWWVEDYLLPEQKTEWESLQKQLMRAPLATA